MYPHSRGIRFVFDLASQIFLSFFLFSLGARLSSKTGSVRLTLSRWWLIKEKWRVPIFSKCRNSGNNGWNCTIFGPQGNHRFNNQFGLNGAFKMADNCCQRMCHFGLFQPISLKPVGGITSHLGHKVILRSSIVSQTLTLGWLVYRYF